MGDDTVKGYYSSDAILSTTVFTKGMSSFTVSKTSSVRLSGVRIGYVSNIELGNFYFGKYLKTDRTVYQEKKKDGFSIYE